MQALYIIPAIILFASNFVGTRAALIEYNPFEMAVLRFVISSFFLLFLSFPGKIKLPNSREWLFFIGLGFVLFLNIISLNYGMQTISAGETNLVVSTSQIFQVLIAWVFLNEKISNRFVTGLFCCFSGVAIIAIQNSDGFSLNIGVIYVLIAAVMNSIYFTAQKPLLNKYKPLVVISYAFWIATLFLLPFGNNVIESICNASVKSTMAVIYVGFASSIGNILWSKALSAIKASSAAIILYTIPVVTIIIGYLYLHELPSLISCLGGAVIMGGVFMANLSKFNIKQSGTDISPRSL